MTLQSGKEVPNTIKSLEELAEVIRRYKVYHIVQTE